MLLLYYYRIWKTRRRILLLAEEGWRDSLIEAGAGVARSASPREAQARAKRKRDSAQPQEKRAASREARSLNRSSAKSGGCRSDHPVCAASVASQQFISGAATPPLRGGECGAGEP